MQNDITNVVTMLQEAKKLNNDLGRHVRRASFSTHLTGRFYQNNSLESHKARSNRISKMKAERRKLEKFLELEEKKIKFLEERLYEKQMERRREEDKRMIQNLACIKIQSSFRCFSAYNKLQLLRVERDIKVYVVLWLQSIFRGNRDRCLVQRMKDELFRQLKEKLASICIQTQMRQYIAKNRLSEKRQENIIRRHNAACIVQALIRGHRDRCKAKRRRQELASILIQRVYRGFCGRKLRDKKRTKKTKRIPLHERRYSSYGAAVAVDISRRGSMSSKNVSNVTNTQNRRASLPGWDVLRKAVSAEAAKVKKPLKQVVDRIPSRCIPTNVECSSVQSKATSSTRTSYKLKEKPKRSQRTKRLVVADDSKNPKAEGMKGEPSTELGSLENSTKIRHSTDNAAYESPADTNSHNGDCYESINTKEDEKQHLNHLTELEKLFDQGHDADIEEDEKANRNHLVPSVKSPKAPVSSQEHNINADDNETENHDHTVPSEKVPKLIDSNHENVIHTDDDKTEQYRKPPETAENHNHSVPIEKSPTVIDSNNENDIHAGNSKTETSQSHHEIGLQSSSTHDSHALHLHRSITQRALQISRKKKAEEEEQRRIKAARKAELQKLEEERRSKMKKEMEERKARKAAKSLSKKKNNQTILPIADVKRTGKIRTKTENISTEDIGPQKESNLLVISSQIEIDVSFLDGPFDQDCIETEFDLD